MIARTEVDILETKGKLVRRILEITHGVPNGPDIVTTLFKNRIDLEKLKQAYAPMLAMEARNGWAWYQIQAFTPSRTDGGTMDPPISDHRKIP